MEPNYQDIADLFGLVPPTPEATAVEEIDPLLSPSERGHQYLIAGEYERAIHNFRQAVEESKGQSVDALKDLAAAYSTSEALPQAYRQYLKALKINEEDVDAHLGVGEVLLREGHVHDGLDAIDRALTIDPTQASLHYKKAEVLHHLGHRKKALRSMQSAILLAPDQSFYHQWTADLLIEMKEYDAAIESLRAAVELAPGDAYLYQRTAVAFWGAGRLLDAVKAIRLASDLDPENRVFLGILHRFYLELDEIEEAEHLVKRAGKLDPYDQEVLLRNLREANLPV